MWFLPSSQFAILKSSCIPRNDFLPGGPNRRTLGGVTGATYPITQVRIQRAARAQPAPGGPAGALPGAGIGTVQQVVSIAQWQFCGHIAVAVRAPNFRQLVMLYSEATGQHMPLSAFTPYAGSRVEHGGNLSQQPWRAT
jgi:hypothetical protein